LAQWRAKMKLAIACAVLFFVTLVHADTLTTVNGTIVYPNGSVITSETIVVPTSSNGFEGFTEIEFQFQDGSGFALSDSSGAVGDFGFIAFTGAGLESLGQLGSLVRHSYELHRCWQRIRIYRCGPL